MSRPSFQFYPADWRNNAKLRRCSWEARGAWLEVMCLMHDSENYGILRWNLKEIAQAIGAPMKLLNELVSKGVIKGADKQHDGLFYTPISGRKPGPTVTLVEAGNGPFWMSSRMVIDEYKRQQRGKNSRFGDGEEGEDDGINNGQIASPMPPFGEHKDEEPKPSPNTTPSQHESDGSSSSSSPSVLNTSPKGDVAKPAQQVVAPDLCPHSEIIAAYHELLPMATRIRDWTPARQQLLRARWREKPERQNVDWWRGFFGYVAKSDFLTGKVSSRDRRPFAVSLEWLCQAKNFVKVIEGKYENDRQEVAA